MGKGVPCLEWLRAGLLRWGPASLTGSPFLASEEHSGGGNNYSQVSVSVLLAPEPSLPPNPKICSLPPPPPTVLKHLPEPSQAVFQELWPRQALMSAERHSAVHGAELLTLTSMPSAPGPLQRPPLRSTPLDNPSALAYLPDSQEPLL